MCKHVRPPEQRKVRALPRCPLNSILLAAYRDLPFPKMLCFPRLYARRNASYFPVANASRNVAGTQANRAARAHLPSTALTQRSRLCRAVQAFCETYAPVYRVKHRFRKAHHCTCLTERSYITFRRSDQTQLPTPPTPTHRHPPQLPHKFQPGCRLSVLQTPGCARYSWRGTARDPRGQSDRPSEPIRPV